MNVFEELTKVSKLKVKDGETKAAFAHRLFDKIGKLCDKDEEVWKGLSEDAKAWYNLAGPAIHEKSELPPLDGFTVKVAEVATEAAPPAKKVKEPKVKKAKAPKPEKAAAKAGNGKGGRHPLYPGGIRALKDRWNELVAEADKLGGIKGARVHTSDFENYELGRGRVSWLEEQIELKREAPAPEQAAQATA